VGHTMQFLHILRKTI